MKVKETLSDEAREVQIILILYSSPVISTLSHHGEVVLTLAQRRTIDGGDIAALEQFWQDAFHDATDD